MGSPIIGSSDRTIIGEKQLLEKVGNKTKGLKLVLMKQSKGLRTPGVGAGTPLYVIQWSPSTPAHINLLCNECPFYLILIHFNITAGRPLVACNL
jgi:hypothetical protein